MSRIRTASRLHFGLISLTAEGAAWPDRHGAAVLPARRFGGVGMMIEAPGLVVRAEPADAWSAEGPLAERALASAGRFVASVEEETPGAVVPAQRLVVEAAPREHVGLGSGTQIALAVAKLLAEALGRSMSPAELARRVQRAARSALGVHGFAQGGFLVEGGKRAGAELSPLVARMAFPPAWWVVLVLPRQRTGLHGPDEQAAFARLKCSQATTEALCRLVLLGMLPALAEEDLSAFGEALFDFNARAGEVFAPAQGGTYAGAAVEELIEFIRRQGVAGAGQSSWGPGVFAVTDEERAAHLADRLRDVAAKAEILVSRGCNQGAIVEAVGRLS
jgi:beta-RFAP synthase